MAGKLAPSLKGLFASIDFLWPRRNHGIDGWYHAPQSGVPQGHMPGHNGYSHAIDVDVRGINPPWIIDHITRNNGVMFYIIWDVRVWSVETGWNGHPYHVPKGGSLHKDHMHIEIYQTDRAEGFGGPWFGGSTGSTSGSGSNSDDPVGNAGIGAADSRDYRDVIYTFSNDAWNAAVHLNGGANYVVESRNF